MYEYVHSRGHKETGFGKTLVAISNGNLKKVIEDPPKFTYPTNTVRIIFLRNQPSAFTFIFKQSHLILPTLEREQKKRKVKRE